MNEIKIREATIDDVSKIQSIYQYYVEETVYSFAYEVPNKEFFNKIIESKYPFIVAEIDNQILGYSYAQPFKMIPAYRFCCEISIYVDHEAKQMGIGSSLLNSLEDRLNTLNIHLILSHITESNARSIKFHLKHGYKILGEFPEIGFKNNYYQDTVMLGKYL